LKCRAESRSLEANQNKIQNMEIGICCHPTDAAQLPANVIDFLEVNVQNFLVPEKGEADFRLNLELGRRAIKPIKSASCFLPGDLKCVGPNLDQERLMRYAQTAFSRAEQVGVEIIVFGSGGARTMPENYSPKQAMEDFTALLRQFGPMAQSHGVTLVVEPLNKAECNFINSLAEGAEAVERCNHPNVQLLADLYHMLKDGEPVSEIVRFGRLIKHTHVAELAGRACPGKSHEDFSPFFEALREANYTGRVALECLWENMAVELEPSMRYLRASSKAQ
jgi:sugar phosphate isomerase/epimerase